MREIFDHEAHRRPIEDKRRLSMGRKQGKVIFCLTVVVAVFLASSAFSQAPQPKMERVLEELRELRKRSRRWRKRRRACWGKSSKGWSSMGSWR